MKVVTAYSNRSETSCRNVLETLYRRTVLCGNELTKRKILLRFFPVVILWCGFKSADKIEIEMMLA